MPEFDEDDGVLISSFSEEAPDEKTFLEPRDIFSSFSYSRSSKQNERERKRKKDALRTRTRARGNNTALLLLVSRRESSRKQQAREE